MLVNNLRRITINSWTVARISTPVLSGRIPAQALSGQRVSPRPDGGREVFAGSVAGGYSP
ncbi:MAG: hypothetical protein QOF78_1963 [Phycisphaerales bacterium]|nr:hypothetical protein [Phycisphaerales bacterium]